MASRKVEDGPGGASKRQVLCRGRKRSLRASQELGRPMRPQPARAPTLSWEVCFVHEPPESKVKRGQPCTTASIRTRQHPHCRASTHLPASSALFTST